MIDINAIISNVIEEELYIKPLLEVDPEDYKYRFEEIESENFSAYFSQSGEDVVSDWNEPGFFGMGMFDDKDDELYGYVYGYAFSPDELGDMQEVMDDNISIEIYDKSFEYLKDLDSSELGQIFNSKTSFYIDTLVVSNQYRKRHGHTKEYYYALKEMISSFLDGVKNKGYKYVVFNALSDTLKFLYNRKTGSIKGRTASGERLVTKIAYEDGETIIVMEFN